MQIRLGILGLGGSWDRRHKPALLRFSDKFAVRAVYDEVSQRARTQAAELECDAVDGFTALMERKDIDAVYILGSSWCGVEPIRTACRTRKAIFLGSPFAMALAHAPEAVQAIRDSGVRFMVEFPWRFYPATTRLMELLASGLGAPHAAFCEHLDLVDDKSGSGLVYSRCEWDDVLFQLVDWLRFVFMRDPVATHAVGGDLSGGPCRGYEGLAAQFDKACCGHVMVRRYVDPHWKDAAMFRRPPAFQVVAEHGVAYLDMPRQVTWFDQSGRHDEVLEMDRPLGELLCDRFYRIIVHGLEPTPGLSDVERAYRMVTEARRTRSCPPQ